MRNLNNRVGENIENKVFGTIKIVEYFNNLNCTIQFEDGTIVKNIQYVHLKNGQIKNPNTPRIHGIGYMGQGIYTSWKEHLRIYKTWVGVLDRCYSEKLHGIHPTYTDCIADTTWHNYQVFAKWYEENYNPEIMQGWQLDKDILIKGNKIYSPETCCFVPSQINNLFIKNNINRGLCLIGVTKVNNRFVAQININGKVKKIGSFMTELEAFQAYKEAKEKHIKETANKFKNQITEKVYQAMYNYKVEITD